MALLDFPPPEVVADPLEPDTAELPSQPLGIAHLRVRPLDSASDEPRLLAMCPYVSPQSLYQRFFTSFHRLPAPLLALLLHVDHDPREELVVLDGYAIVAVGRYAAMPKRADEADV